MESLVGWRSYKLSLMITSSEAKQPTLQMRKSLMMIINKKCKHIEF